MNLANKYRPKNFSEVVGQLIPKTVLQKEFDAGALKQAYLFVGQSGGGKTTSARILANMIKGFTIELDVASHNSADDMKELVRSIRTKPIGYDKTVVILDEAHNLSNLAANSLLITLEQPPEHVIFILCTTNGDKIMDTIKNRCEVLTFFPLQPADITQQLITVCESEGINFELIAIESIAKQSNGSMRQALSYLDVVADSDITIKSVTDKLVRSTYDSMLNVMYAWIDSNTNEMLAAIETVEANKFVQDFFVFILDLNVYIKTKNIACTGIPQVLEEELKQLTVGEQAAIQKLLSPLYELQYKGRNSPILKEMFIACLMVV